MMALDHTMITRDQSVYVLHVPALGYFKVGRASDPIKRTRQIQNGCPEKIELIGLSLIDERGVAAADFEHAVHSALFPYRSHGEWFAKIDRDLVIGEWARVWNELASGLAVSADKRAHAISAGEFGLKPGRPKIIGPRPWDDAGISRRTYYRRQKEAKK